MSRLFTRTVQVVAVTVVTALAVVGFVNLVSGGSATGIVTASSGAVQVCPATGCTATSCHATDPSAPGPGTGARGVAEPQQQGNGAAPRVGEGSNGVQVCPATGCTATSCHATSGLGGGRQRVGGRQGGGEDFVDGESFDD